jgi:hypothetical protein
MTNVAIATLPALLAMPAVEADQRPSPHPIVPCLTGQQCGVRADGSFVRWSFGEMPPCEGCSLSDRCLLDTDYYDDSGTLYGHCEPIPSVQLARAQPDASFRQIGRQVS